MKKLTPKQRERQRRLMAYRWRSDRYQYLLRRRRQASRERSTGSLQRIKAPKVFGLGGHNALLLLKFIKQLENATKAPHISCILLDFASTELMIADGTLYFLANFERLKLLHPRKKFRLHLPADAIVEQVLYHIGIASMCGLEKELPLETLDKSVRHWHKASGQDVNTKTAGPVFGSFEGKITKELQRSVYTGISEAMTNCLHHAYTDNVPKHSRRWWLFSREYEGEMHVVFCDLGMGIPKSLYQRSDNVDAGWWARLENWFVRNAQGGLRPKDAMKIKAAIEIGQTRTKHSYRGKGLKQIVDFLDKFGNNASKVIIYSGRGVYRRTPKKGKTVELAHALSEQERKAGIRGTLIHWSVPLIGGSD